MGHEPQRETEEDLRVRERGPDGEPEESDKAQQGNAVKPQRKNKPQELLDLRGKRPAVHIAAAFSFNALREERTFRVLSHGCRWCGSRQPGLDGPTLVPRLAYFPL